MNPELTTEQLKVVNSPCRISITLATPGSGKTTVIVARALRLWHSTREPILIVTFSRKAAQEIQQRLGPDNLQHIEVRTIHGLCFSIIKQHWVDLGNLAGGNKWPAEPHIISKNDELELLHELFPEDNIVKIYDQLIEFRKWPVSPQSIMRLFMQGIYFGKVSKRDLEIWSFYERERIARGLINFEDMTNLANILIPLPFVANDLAKKYSHLLIDEAQDTSESQWQILRPIVYSATTTLAVGDFNQSVFGWRSADGSILNNIRSLPDAVTFSLSESFRSGDVITKLANLLAFDKTSKIKSKTAGGTTVLKKFSNMEAEVSWVLSQLDEKSAVVSRTNSYLERFERMALERSMGYRGVGFYRSEHTKDLARFIKGFSGDNVLSIIEKAYIENNSYTAIEKADFKLSSSIIEEKGLTYFLDLVSKSEQMDPLEGFTLTTGHGAKGLEWDKVFVVGCHNGHVPHRLSKDEREERNILYVMTTRARKELVITCQSEFSHFLPAEILNGT